MTTTLSMPRRALGPIAAATLAGLLTTHARAVTIDDWQSSASACTPINSSTLGTASIPANGAYVRAPLAPASRLVYVCNVLDSFATAVPPWNFMVLQYLDPVGNAVQARLYEKDKVTGTTVLLATASSVAAVPVSLAVVPVPAMNFASHSYHVVLTLTPQKAIQVQAHMVTLTQ